MTQYRALSQIEGSHDPIVPGSVFTIDDETAERLLGMNAIREASKEDVAMAKVKGLLLEDTAIKAEDKTDADAKVEPTKAAAKADAKAPAKNAAAKADDVL